MDPNATLEQILDNLYQMTVVSDNSVKHDILVETIAKMHDVGKWIERGGDGPNLIFNYEIFQS